MEIYFSYLKYLIMFFDGLRRFIRKPDEGHEYENKDLGIEEVIDDVGKKTNSLIKTKKIKSISKFYINYQILLSEEIKQDIKKSDLDALNSIIVDSENLRREMNEEDRLYMLEGYKDDILDIISRKKELLKSNVYIEKGLNALIEVINQRIKFINSK